MASHHNQRKHVAFYLGGQSGGVETFVANLTANLPPLGWIPTVLVNMAAGSHWCKYYNRKGFEVIELPFREVEDPDGKGYILDALRKLGADLYVPCYQEIPHSVVPELLAETIASVLIANASYTDYLAEIVPYAWCAQRFVGVSQTICDLLKQMPEVPSDRVRYIPYGVCLAESFPSRSLQSSGTLRIIYTGRMDVENKQVWRYLELAQILRDQGLDFILTLLGDGPAYAQMLETVNTSPKLRNSVRMPGVVYPDSVPEFLLNHDVFVLLSDTEGLPLSLIEAMGHGLVPIASDIASGVAELIQPGRNGFLTPIGDVRAVATVIEDLYRDLVLRTSMAREAFDTVSGDFSIGQMARRYALLFDEATSIT